MRGGGFPLEVLSCSSERFLCFCFLVFVFVFVFFFKCFCLQSVDIRGVWLNMKNPPNADMGPSHPLSSGMV